MRSYLCVISLITIIMLSSFASPVSSAPLVLGEKVEVTYSEYHSMYNTGYFPDNLGGWVYHQNALIPGEAWADSFYYRELGNNYDGNSTFLLCDVEDTAAPNSMIKRIDVNASDEYSIDFLLRYCGSSAYEEGEYTWTNIGVWSNDTFVLTLRPYDQYSVTAPSNFNTNFTGVTVQCMTFSGSQYMRLYARIAENGLLGSVLLGPFSSSFTSNPIYHIMFERWNNSEGIWKYNFVIVNTANSATVFQDTGNIIGTNVPITWFGACNKPECSQLGSMLNTHILELKNMTSYGYNLPWGGDQSKKWYAGHVVHVTKIVTYNIGDEPVLTIPDIFPHIEPNESLALVIIGFGGVFILATIFMLRRR